MNQNDMKQQLAAKAQSNTALATSTAPKNIFEMVEAQKPAIQAAFGTTDEKYALMFIRQARTQLQLNPMLQKCTPESFLGAMMLAAQLRLQLNPGMRTAYLVPYARYKKTNSGYEIDRYEAQFQIGVGGYQELFYRHEKAVALDVFTVYEGDDCSADALPLENRAAVRFFGRIGARPAELLRNAVGAVRKVDDEISVRVIVERLLQGFRVVRLAVGDHVVRGRRDIHDLSIGGEVCYLCEGAGESA